MSTTYTFEHAKSNRSSCRKCKNKIEKDILRIGVHNKDPNHPDRVMTAWHHTACFMLPQKLKKEGYDATRFVEELLEDNTDNQELEEMKEQIIADVESKPPKKKKGDDEEGEGNAMTRLKAHLKRERAAGNKEEDGASAKKKAKTDLTDREQAMLDVYVQFERMKVDELKDILGWNRQFKTGTKDMVLARIIDGQLHGRLGRCPVCSQGQLQLKDENAETVICKGYYDEDLSTRIPCDFEGPALDAPRLLPWYTEEPTEDEKAEMDRIKEEVKAGRWSAKVAASPSTKNAAEALADQAKALDWDLTSTDGIKKATNDLCDIVTEDGKLDLPEGQSKLRMTIGGIIAANRNMTAEDAMQAVIDKFGFAESKKAAAANKQAAMETVCKCPENATLMSLFHEMADLYFKEGNTFAGVSTRKAENAIKDLPFVITEENALGLGKNKTKVDGIGKGSAEKMHEYLTTGKIDKLEKKRAGLP